MTLCTRLCEHCSEHVIHVHASTSHGAVGGAQAAHYPLMRAATSAFLRFRAARFVDSSTRQRRLYLYSPCTPVNQTVSQIECMRARRLVAGGSVCNYIVVT